MSMCVAECSSSLGNATHISLRDKDEGKEMVGKETGFDGQGPICSAPPDKEYPASLQDLLQETMAILMLLMTG